MLIRGRIHGLPAEDTEAYFKLEERVAKKNATQVHYNHQRAAPSARWLREHPERLPMPWADYCREVLQEDAPGWIDFLIDNEAQLKGKGYAEARSAQERAKKAKPQPTPGGDRRSEEAKADQGANGTLKRGSNQAGYLTARIARDRPDILERMKAGEYRSVRQAAIEAGIVKVPTTLEKLRKLWEKATPEERRAFLLEVTA